MQDLLREFISGLDQGASPASRGAQSWWPLQIILQLCTPKESKAYFVNLAVETAVLCSDGRCEWVCANPTNRLDWPLYRQRTCTTEQCVQFSTQESQFPILAG